MRLSALVGSALLLSGCSVLEDWGVLPAVESVVEDIATPDEAAAPTELEEALTPEDTGFVIPTCDELFSAGQTGALIAQERVNMGDTSEGDYGYGTTNPELVGLLKNVRTDLRISCTWYLPASESVSVTSLAVVNPDEASAVSAALESAGATQQETGAECSGTSIPPPPMNQATTSRRKPTSWLPFSARRLWQKRRAWRG